MLLPSLSQIHCPVCGRFSSDKFCPKKDKAHETLKNTYTSGNTNPFWTTEGFRLRWDDTEILRVFDEAKRLTNALSIKASVHYVEPKESMNTAYLSPNLFTGMTEDEVFAVCVLQCYNSIEFPKASDNVDKCPPMFASYDIAIGMRNSVIEQFGFLRNLYTIMTAEAKNPAYKRFRIGINRLLMKWLLPDHYDDFVSENTVMWNALYIKPSFKKKPAITGFPDITAMPDNHRYGLYNDYIRNVGFETLFSHLYYHLLPRFVNKRSLWNDIMYVLESSDNTDIFGFPAFVFYPENRLYRMMFLFAMACSRAQREADDGMNFLKFDKIGSYGNLINFVAPYTIPSQKIWRAHDWCWAGKYIFDNTDIFKGYVSAVVRKKEEWFVNETKTMELFRRICGYAKDEPISLVDGQRITSVEVASLQGGSAPMVNFQKALQLLAPYIDDPSPLPYVSEPRFGILFNGIDAAYANNTTFACACFQELEKDGSPKPIAPNSMLFKIMIAYHWKQKSGKDDESKDDDPNRYRELTLTFDDPNRYRELTLTLDLDCPICHSRVDIVEYAFLDNMLKYWTLCPKCVPMRKFVCKHGEFEQRTIDFGVCPNTMYGAGCKIPISEGTPMYDQHMETYDKDYASILFKEDGNDQPKIEVNFDVKTNYPNATRLVLTSKTNKQLVRHIDMPQNAWHGLSFQRMHVCPYDVIEKTIEYEESAVGEYQGCQKMPNAWKRGIVPKQYKLLLPGSDHILTKIDEIEENGVVTSRWECEDHKQRMLDFIETMRKEPGKATLSRGDIELKRAFKSNVKFRVGDPNVLLSVEEEETTKQIIETKFMFSDGKVAESENLMESTKAPLGMDLRHFFIFDEVDEKRPEDSPCSKNCKEWEELQMIHATAPFEPYAKTYRIEMVKKKIRMWQVSSSPSAIIPGRSMPMIFTVTPKMMVKIKKGLSKETVDSALSIIHIDVSGSMDAKISTMKCPYIFSENTCRKCGQEFRWNKDTMSCERSLSRLDIAKRFCVSLVRNCQLHQEFLMLYGFESSCINVVPMPSTDYSGIINRTMTILTPLGGTEPETSFTQMLETLDKIREERGKPIRANVFVLTDGDITPKKIFKQWFRVLREYGPIFLYQISGSDMQSIDNELRVLCKGLGWNENDNDFEIIKVDISDDGGMSLMRNAGTKLNKSRK